MSNTTNKGTPGNVCRFTTGAEDDTLSEIQRLANEFRFDRRQKPLWAVLDIVSRLDDVLSAKEGVLSNALDRASEAEKELGALKQKLTELAG